MAFVRAAGLGQLLSTWRERLVPRADAIPATRQVGAIPYAIVQNEVVFLLITSRRTGRWIFPKGSLIEGLTSSEVAAHEAFEEAGVEGEIETTPLGAYQSFKVSGISRKPIRVEMFPLRVTRQLDTWPEKGSRHRHWVILQEAKRLLSEPQLAEMAGALSRRLFETP